MKTQAGRDRLYASLNPLVMDGTLTPDQADRVYLAVGRDGETPAKTQRAGWERSRLLAALSILAAGLLATAYIVAAVIDGQHGQGWKSTTLLLGTALVGAAAAAAWLVPLRHRTWSVWVSGALGALALAGLSLAILVLGGTDKDALVYVTGVVMLAGGGVAFWFLRGQLYPVVAAIGGMIVLAKIFADTISGPDEGDALAIGIAFLFYGLAVAAVGWFLTCRRLLCSLGLFIGGFAMFLVMVINAAALAFADAFSDPSLDSGGFEPGSPSAGSVRSDIRVALLLGLLVVVAAALAHAFDGFVGFSVLAFVGASVLPVTAMFAWHTEHPMRWGAGFALVATLGLAAVIALQVDRRTPTAHHGYAGSPIPPNQPHDPRADTVAR